jgi:hypothetical protein
VVEVVEVVEVVVEEVVEVVEVVEFRVYLRFRVSLSLAHSPLLSL